MHNPSKVLKAELSNLFRVLAEPEAESAARETVEQAVSTIKRLRKAGAEAEANVLLRCISPYLTMREREHLRRP